MFTVSGVLDVMCEELVGESEVEEDVDGGLEVSIDGSSFVADSGAGSVESMAVTAVVA